MNTKSDCIRCISASLRRTATWRRRLAVKFVDPRNVRAAESLDCLAVEIEGISDRDWEAIQPHFEWASDRWLDAVSDATRAVGFGTPDLRAFIATLVGLLQVSAVAAA